MLFKSCDFQRVAKKETPTNFSMVGANSDSVAFLEGTQKKELAIFREYLPQKQIISYYTNGVFSTHEVIKVIAEYLGESALTISTWSISENSVRTLDTLRKKGIITKLSMLIDFRVPHHTPKSYQYLQGIADVLGLANCHAKCAVFSKNEEHWFLQTSSNLSQNNRKEVGTLFKINELGLQHKNWIEHSLTNGE